MAGYTQFARIDELTELVLDSKNVTVGGAEAFSRTRLVVDIINKGYQNKEVLILDKTLKGRLDETHPKHTVHITEVQDLNKISDLEDILSSKTFELVVITGSFMYLLGDKQKELNLLEQLAKLPTTILTNEVYLMECELFDEPTVHIEISTSYSTGVNYPQVFSVGYWNSLRSNLGFDLHPIDLKVYKVDKDIPADEIIQVYSKGELKEIVKNHWLREHDTLEVYNIDSIEVTDEFKVHVKLKNEMNGAIR